MEKFKLNSVSDVEPLLGVLTKEYESLRKEIDVRTDATRAYGWPVILVAFTALAAFKVDNIDWDLILLFIPTAGMTIAALAANAGYDMDKASRALSLTEDKIFLLTREPLLTYESQKVSRWNRKESLRHFVRDSIISLLYVVLQGWLYFSYLPEKTFAHVDLSKHPGRALVLWGVMLAPVLLFFHNSRLRSNVRGGSVSTRLIAEIGRCESPEGKPCCILSDIHAKPAEATAKTS